MDIPNFTECNSETKVSITSKSSSFDICYSVGLYKSLILQDLNPENLQWYRFKNIKDKTTLIKYLDTTEKKFDVRFNSYNQLINGVKELIIVTPNADEFNIYILDLTDIKQYFDFDKKGSIKFKDSKAFFYPSIKLEQLSIEYQSERIQIDMIDSKTSPRYQSIMERNYLQKLNYLLFLICCSELKDILTVNYQLPDGTEEAYKKLYSDMTEIRERNKCFEAFINNNKNDIEHFKNNYYIYFQENILKFNDFFQFWNKEDSRTCKYCGISEKQINSGALEIQTKRFYSRGKTMEIDKKDAFGEYTKDNIILSCYWCNNAKTDEFTLDEFQPIAKGINCVWNNRLDSKDSVKFPESTYKEENDCNEK